MSFYQEPDTHIRDKVKIVLEFSNYATKEQLEYATCIDTSDLDAKKGFIALKAGVHKLDINKLTNLDNSRTKVDALDVDKLKTVGL